MRGMAMSVRFLSQSSTGLVRKDNQDTVLCLDAYGLFAVADGMGGGEAGALASQMICEALRGKVASRDQQDRKSEITAAVADANELIFKHARDHGFKQMGSTVVLLVLDKTAGKKALIGHIGDSRVYRVRAGAAELLTRDHSLGSELEARVGGAAGHKLAMRSSPFAHILTRAVGTEKKVAIDWREVEVASSDRFVVCSDGVHDVIETDKLAELVNGGTLEGASRKLEREIVRCGAPDNYSYILLEIGR